MEDQEIPQGQEPGQEPQPGQNPPESEPEQNPPEPQPELNTPEPLPEQNPPEPQPEQDPPEPQPGQNPPEAQVSMEELLRPAEPAAPPSDEPAPDVPLRAVLEAIIYVAEEPLTLAQMAAALRQPAERVQAVIDELIAEFDKPEHGVTIRQVAGGFKMATKPEHHEAVRSFVKSLKPPLKLSLPALETLAVIAYKQPVTAPEIMEIRGVQGAGVLKTLLDRRLIAAAGRKNVIGKPILYKTTKEFLIQFGLKDLSELPSLKEFEEIRRMAFADGELPDSSPDREGEVSPQAANPSPDREGGVTPAEPPAVPSPDREEGVAPEAAPPGLDAPPADPSPDREGGEPAPPAPPPPDEDTASGPPAEPSPEGQES